MAENGNGNGEIKQLAGVKRAYRGKVASLEADLKAEFEANLADGKKRLKNEYLEAVVDVIFADESLPVEVTVNKAEIAVAVTPKLSVSVESTPLTKCPECDAAVGPNDKFCAECAYPLRDETVKEEKASEIEGDAILGTAGRQRRTRRRA